jgi:hypothetical protein
MALILGAEHSLVAQGGPPQPAAQQHEHLVTDIVKFLAGGVLGLGLHESGHLIFDLAFEADPTIKRVQFGPFPFFAVSHRGDLPPRQEFAISSAGFWMQEGTSEWLLTTRPDIRHEHAPLAEGLLAFNVLNSVGYAAVAAFKAGPYERDTGGMARSIRVDERAIAVIIIVPAILDAYRYFKPEAKWAIWTSRLLKIGSVLIVAKGS